METNPRIFGLDFYRAAAILMVLLANTIYFFQLQLPAISQLAPVIGYIGLEIFFVLSGFLLGKSLYPVFMAESFNWNATAGFIKRKLWRILPLYVLVLLINTIMALAMQYPVYFIWRYFLLIQNFSGTIPPFFPESWGLPVIIFAMVALPLLLFGFSKIVKQNQKTLVFPLVIFGLIAVFFWTKWLYNSIHPQTNMIQWEASLKTVAIYRFDAVFIGVFFSWLIGKIPALAKWFFALLGLTGVGFLVVGIGFLQLVIENYPEFWNIYYLPLTSVVLGLFLPILYEWHSAPGFLKKPTAFLSKISYSIYLVHFSLVLLLMEHFLLKDASVGSNLVFLATGYFMLAILAGYVLFRVFENGLFKRLRG